MDTISSLYGSDRDAARLLQKLHPDLSEAEIYRAVDRAWEDGDCWPDEFPDGLHVGRDAYPLPGDATAFLWYVAVHTGEGPEGIEYYTTREDAMTQYEERIVLGAEDDDDDIVVSDQCPGPGVTHCDNCGSLTPKLDDEFLGVGAGWMQASIGTACGSACYTDMTDGVGAHAELCHRPEAA